MKKMNRRTIIGIIVIFALLFSSYGCIELWGTYTHVPSPVTFMAITTPVIFTYAYTSLMLSRRGGLIANLKGTSPVLTAVIRPPRQTLLVYTIVLTWVGLANVVFNGFSMPRGVGSDWANVPYSIGTYRIIMPDATIRRTSDVISTGTTTAFIDLNDSDTHESQYEPTISYDEGTQTMTISFPPWGGGPEDQLGYDITDYGVLEFNSGIFAFTTSGKYEVDWTFTSIDPDTGGADDSTGTDPSVKTFTSTVYRWGGFHPGNFLLVND